MNCVTSVTRNSALGLLALVLLTGGCATKAPQSPKASSETTGIVWPSPPDPPRVQFVKTIRSNRDVEGRTKRNLKEILLGIDPDRLAVTLSQPMGVTMDSAGRILVTDTRTVGIHVYDVKNHAFALYGAKGTGALNWPIGIDVDGEDNIYVADHALKEVHVFDREGTFLYAIKDFQNPVGVAVDKTRKRLYVVDSKLHRVKVFSLEGRPVATIGERGTEEGQFNYPTYCCVDKEGNLYVVDTGNWRVQIFDPDYEVTGSFGSLGLHPGQFTRPKGVSVDDDGNIYVVDAAYNNVQIFNGELDLLMPFSGPGSDPGFLLLPTGIHVAPDGTIVVCDFGHARLQLYRRLKAGG